MHRRTRKRTRTVTKSDRYSTAVLIRCAKNGKDRNDSEHLVKVKQDPGAVLKEPREEILKCNHQCFLCINTQEV